MHADEPRPHVRRQLEAGAVHAERREEVILQIRIELLAADRLDGLAGPVDVDAVFPALARIERERQGQRLVLARGHAGNAGVLHVLAHAAVPDVVAIAGRVGEQVLERDRPLGRTQLRLAARVEAFEHLHVGDLGQDFPDRTVERELALFDKLHRRSAGDRLGHRGDPEHGVERHRIRLAEVALAECALIDDLAAGRGHCDDTRHLSRASAASRNA